MAATVHNSSSNEWQHSILASFAVTEIGLVDFIFAYLINKCAILRLLWFYFLLPLCLSIYLYLLAVWICSFVWCPLNSLLHFLSCYFFLLNLYVLIFLCSWLPIFFLSLFFLYWNNLRNLMRYGFKEFPT